jgi:hypothetical protein
MASDMPNMAEIPKMIVTDMPIIQIQSEEESGWVHFHPLDSASFSTLVSLPSETPADSIENLQTWFIQDNAGLLAKIPRRF